MSRDVFPTQIQVPVFFLIRLYANAEIGVPREELPFLVIPPLPPVIAAFPIIPPLPPVIAAFLVLPAPLPVLPAPPPVLPAPPPVIPAKAGILTRAWSS